MTIRTFYLAAVAVGLCCAGPIGVRPASSGEAVAEPQLAAAGTFPIASDARIAGDDKQTRFILQLDRKIDVRAFALADPYRVVLDIPQVDFQLPARTGQTGRGMIKAFRFGLVMPGGSRVVMDLSQPAKIDKAYVLDAANGQPPKLVVELSATDRPTFLRNLAGAARPELRTASVSDAPKPAEDARPLIVIDPGHGGIDNGTQASSGELEKTIVLNFATALRDRIEKAGKYRVVMTRSDDTFIPLADRVQIARSQSAALFMSIHADALPRREGDAQGATIYTLSDTASDAEAARLAESENHADVIAGIDLADEPADVADILIDLARRETKTFSNRFAKILLAEMKSSVRLHKQPLKSAGFRVLKAPDIPSVLIELGYVSNKSDLEHLVSDDWRSKTVTALVQAVDGFFAKHVTDATAAR